MTGDFDPYHRWLGIPPQEQPPNHYRLLGLVPFEDDVEVIRDAAERQMAHVRKYALGPHAELSQRILNQLGAAKACLMNAAKKAAYDQRLREQAAAAKTVGPPAAPQTEPAPAVPAKPPPVASHSPRAPTTVASKPAGPGAAIGAAPPGDRLPKPAGASHRKERLPWVIGAAGGTLALIVAAVLIGVLSGLAKSPATPKTPEVTARAEKPLPPKPPEPPTLAPIQDQTVDKGTRLQFPVMVEHRGSAGRLVYQLAAGKPEGAEIDPHSGVFTWAPGGNQPVGTYPITVQVVAPELGNATGETTFRVYLRDVNRPPQVVPAQSTYFVDAGKEIRIPLRATDLDQPRDKLTWSLVKNPPGAQVDPLSGDFTWTPTSELVGQGFRVTARVTDDGPEPLYDERSFTIVVNPMRKPPEPPRLPIPTDAYFRLAFPSGQTLTSEVFKDLPRRMRTDGENALNLCWNGSPDAIALWRDSSQQALSVVCSLKSLKLEGPAVAFHDFPYPGKRSSKTPPGAQTPASSRASKPAPMQPPSWADALPRLYGTFHSEKWEGWLATWNERSEKQYCCEYSSGRRNGLCCLFKEDRLAMVLECQADAVQAVHLIRANQVVKTFDSAEQAQGDADAGPLLQASNETTEKVKEDARAFKKQVQREINARINMVNQAKRQEIIDRMGQRDEQNRKGLNRIKEKARTGK